MKTVVLTSLLFAIATIANAIDASISFATFKNDTQPYVEVYTFVLGNSVTYNTEDSISYQASIEVTIVFKQGEKIILADKFNLISQQKANVVDLKRYALQNGIYELEVTVSDNHLVGNIASYKNGVAVQYDTQEQIQQSDIQLVASAGAVKDATHPFAKNRFVLEPLPYHFYGKSADQLLFYNEVYAPEMNTKLQLRYFIEKEAKTNNSALKIEHKQRKTKALMPLLLAMDISNLPSGNYNLVLEVRDSSSELLSKKKVFFQRSNPLLTFESTEEEPEVIEDRFVHEFDEEQLEYSLRALTPILQGDISERLSYVLKEKQIDRQKDFLYNFWRGQNPRNAAFAYEQYMKVVKAVDETFKSGFRHGFETDRGYRYLKYGQPDDIVNVQDDPSAPPYEIWSYNDFPMTNQTNIRFLFYNPSLAGGDYIILHSTALGETNNPQWEVELYRDAPTEIEGNDYFSATKMQSNNGRRARQLMEDF